MRTNIMNRVGAAAILLAANAGSGSGGRSDEGPKDYQVTVGSRNTKEAGTTSTFVITADSYKRAWELGREVTRTGSADFIETHGAGVLRAERASDSAAPVIKAGVLSVKKVDSLQEKRSKKDALTVERLVSVMAERNITMPKALQGLIDELNQAGPAAPAADSAGEQQAAAQ